MFIRKLIWREHELISREWKLICMSGIAFGGVRTHFGEVRRYLEGVGTHLGWNGSSFGGKGNLGRDANGPQK